MRENNGVVEYKGCLYLFGGYNGSQWLNDFHEFSLTTCSWRTVQPKGQPPASRFGYVSVVHVSVSPAVVSAAAAAAAVVVVVVVVVVLRL